ncbi:MAG: signal peptide peptidase SppA [Myxococcales bacterium]|nr:signal peptide peptidase SppA [Myxococcales bacterium]
MNPLRSLWNFCRRSGAAMYWHVLNFSWRRADYDTVEINLRGGVPERRLPGSLFELRRPAGLTHRGLLELLDYLASDDKVKRVILQLGPLGTGLARVQEIGRALDRLRAAGKTLIAQLDTVGLREYLLAAHCQQRVLLPNSLLLITGLRMEIRYFRGLLDKLAVQPDLLVAGKFKNAAETFMRRDASEAAREMTDGLLDDLYAQIVDELARALGKTPDQVRAIIDDGPYPPERAVQAGLVDRLAYRDELLKQLEIKRERKIVGGQRYWHFRTKRDQTRAVMIDAPRVAVLYLSGTIREGRGDPSRGAPGAAVYVKLLRRLRREKKIRAVVLRINSPGGAAGGSDLIRREVQNLAAKKTVLISMGDVAASGGYMIAVGGKRLLAERATLTGSIGVIAGKFAIAGLLEKFGIGQEAYSRGAAAGLYSTSQPFSELERQRMGEIIASSYKSFKAMVAESRGFEPARIDELAEGHVWTGRQALENKLVDLYGGIGDALREAKEAAGGRAGEPIRLIEVPALPSPWRLLWSMSSARMSLPTELAEWVELQAFSGIPFAGLPFTVRIR